MNKEETPQIKHKDKTLFQVGCRNCGQGDYWRVYSDAELFLAVCMNCGHKIEITKHSLTDQQDVKAIPLSSFL